MTLLMQNYNWVNVEAIIIEKTPIPCHVHPYAE